MSKIQTVSLKLFILLLLVSHIESVDADMTPMASMVQQSASNIHLIYLTANEQIIIQNIYISWGFLTLTVKTLSIPGVEFPIGQIHEGGMAALTVSSTGEWYIVVRGNFGAPPAYRLKITMNTFNFYFEGFALTPTDCLVRRMYTRNSCRIQMDIDTFSGLSAKIDFYPSVGDQNTVGIQKLNAASGVVTLDLNMTNDLSSYYLYFCGDMNYAPYMAGIYNRIGSECNFTMPVCGNDIVEYPQLCDNMNGIGCKRCVPELYYVCRTNANLSSTCVYTPPVCGNSIKETGEQCDNGNQTGCVNCSIMTGYTCSNSGSGSICTQNLNEQIPSTVLDKMVKQLQIVFPVLFLILGFMSMILIYNIVLQLILRKNQTNGITYEESTTMKKISRKFESNEVIEVKPYK